MWTASRATAGTSSHPCREALFVDVLESSFRCPSVRESLRVAALAHSSPLLGVTLDLSKGQGKRLFRNCGLVAMVSITALTRYPLDVRAVFIRWRSGSSDRSGDRPNANTSSLRLKLSRKSFS